MKENSDLSDISSFARVLPNEHHKTNTYSISKEEVFTTMRGIVISPVKIIGKNSMTVGNFDSLKLKQYLLYWDKIDYPINNIIETGISPEMEFLMNMGVLQRTKVHLYLSGEMTELYVKSQIKALEINSQLEKGRWTLGQENIDLVLPKEDATAKKGIEIHLFNCLPVPPMEVSFEDILEFKEKRKDELLAFRVLMDNFYQELLKTGDSERAMVSYIEKLKLQIDAIDRTMRESFLKTLKGNLKVRFDFGKIIEKTFFGAAGANALNIPVSAGAVLGLASSFIQISSEISLKPKKISNELKDYAYLYYANKELR